MASPAEVVRQYLVDREIVIHPGEPNENTPYTQLPGDGSTLCFVNQTPDDIDQLVSIWDVAGVRFGASMRDGQSLIHPGIKILVRALDATYYWLAQAIADYLDASNLLTVVVKCTSYYVQRIYRTTSIISVGEQVGKQRQQWSLNARVSFQGQQSTMG